MADSETSTSPPFVTRRGALMGTMLAVFVFPRRAQGSLTPPLACIDSRTRDPAYVLWQEWRAAHQETERLCRGQQARETKLIKMIGPLGLSAEFDDQKRSEAYGSGEIVCQSTHQSRWGAADAEIGYSAAKDAEEQAAAHEQDVAEALWATPAQSFAGVAGKLDAVLREGEWCKECPEFPWPQIRSALTDVIRLGRLDDLARGLPEAAAEDR